MKWGRSNALPLACERCARCGGAGLRLSYGTSVRPCECVYRTVARAVIRRYRLCGEFPRAGLDRRGEEFRADVVGIARRSLQAEDYPFFIRYVLHDGTRTSGQDREDFHRRVYRIEKTVGKAFAETEPYGLFPLDEYFGGVVNRPRWKSQKGEPVKPKKPTGKRPWDVFDSICSPMREVRQAGGSENVAGNAGQPPVRAYAA